MPQAVLGRIVTVSADPSSPAEALAAAETVALLTGEERERWHAVIAPWEWEDSVVAVLGEPPAMGRFIRRVTGGPLFPGRPGMVYAALIGPRTPGSPPSLETVYRMARRLLEGCSISPRLEASCGGRLWAGVGKLAQRPLIELYGEGEAVASVLERAGKSVASMELDRDLIRRDSVERLTSPEWNWGRVQGATHRVERASSAGFMLVVEARLDPPLVEELRIYTDAFVYPPAQAMLLIGQLSGIPPAPTAVLEFLNGWATLVETVGVEYSDVKEALLSIFERMARDADQWLGPRWEESR